MMQTHDVFVWHMGYHSPASTTRRTHRSGFERKVMDAVSNAKAPQSLDAIARRVGGAVARVRRAVELLVKDDTLERRTVKGAFGKPDTHVYTTRPSETP